MNKIGQGKSEIEVSPCYFALGQGTAKTFNSSTFLSVNWHSNIEVIYATKGSGRISCDFVEFTVNAGELFIINSDVFHGFSSQDNAEFEYYYLELDRDFCKYNGIDLSEIRFYENIRDDIAVDKFKKIIENYGLQGQYSSLAVSSAVLDLLYTLCTSYIVRVKPAAKKKKSNVDNIRAAILYIRENLANKLTTAELAKASGISEYYFIREFKRITHYTPVTYINIVRCDTAKRMLFEGGKNIGEIAVLCGFDNMPYFTKTFKKYTGMLPSDIKREKKRMKNL